MCGLFCVNACDDSDSILNFEHLRGAAYMIAHLHITAKFFYVIQSIESSSVV